jgi:molybdenum cofactor biosynthesis enzyme
MPLSKVLKISGPFGDHQVVRGLPRCARLRVEKRDIREVEPASVHDEVSKPTKEGVEMEAINIVDERRLFFPGDDN